MKTAAGNPNGAMTGFLGMGMAQQAGGVNAQNLFAMGRQQEQQRETGWVCSCGTRATGNFCPECGRKRPEATGWICSCGARNRGKFCTECGAKKPAGQPLYRCDRCGWEPEDPQHPPRFCPQCGDPFDDQDIR